MIQQKNGFTLVEILVAFFLFVLVLGGALGGVQQAVGFQRITLERQAAIEEVSYAIEYISRAIRGAQKDTTGSCTAQVGRTFQYPGPQPFRFIDGNGKCREFKRNVVGGQGFLEERISEDDTVGGFSGPGAIDWHRLISDDFNITNFLYHVRGAVDTERSQPRVLFGITVSNKADTQDFLTVQTTMSTRQIDVP